MYNKAFLLPLFIASSLYCADGEGVITIKGSIKSNIADLPLEKMIEQLTLDKEMSHKKKCAHLSLSLLTAKTEAEVLAINKGFVQINPDYSDAEKSEKLKELDDHPERCVTSADIGVVKVIDKRKK